MAEQNEGKGPAESADERAKRIAEAGARAQAARGAQGGAPAGGAAPPPASNAAPAGSDAKPAEGDADRQARIAAARARAQAAAGGGGAAAAAPAPASSEATAAVAAPAATPAVTPAPARPAVAAARAMPSGPDEWRAPAGSAGRVVTARPDAGAVARIELSKQEVANLVTRRSMIRTSFWSALGVTLAGFLLGFVNFFWPRKVTGFGGIVKVPVALVPKPGDPPVKVFDAKAWVVNLKPGEGVPEAFTSFGQSSKDGGILALYQKCPHLGCTVPWRGEGEYLGVKGWFICPCHGSTYSKAGVRVFGPAPRPMDTFEVKANPDGSLDINTSRIVAGAPDNAGRAIKLS